MATAKSKTQAKSTKSTKSKQASGDSYEKSSRCWPGYVPVPGKSEHEEGSCRPKPASKNGGKPVDRETARKKQISLGGKRAEQAIGKSPSAAERRTVSKAAKRHRSTNSAAKSTASTGKSARASTAKRSASSPSKRSESQESS